MPLGSALKKTKFQKKLLSLLTFASCYRGQQKALSKQRWDTWGRNNFFFIKKKKNDQMQILSYAMHFFVICRFFPFFFFFQPLSQWEHVSS